MKSLKNKTMLSILSLFIIQFTVMANAAEVRSPQEALAQMCGPHDEVLLGTSELVNLRNNAFVKTGNDNLPWETRSGWMYIVSKAQQLLRSGSQTCTIEIKPRPSPDKALEIMCGANDEVLLSREELIKLGNSAFEETNNGDNAYQVRSKWMSIVEKVHQVLRSHSKTCGLEKSL